MKSTPDRLASLAAAQGTLARSLESRLLHCEGESAALRNSLEHLKATLDAAAAAGLPFVAAGLRRMAELERQITGLAATAEALRREHLAARARQDMFSSRAKQCAQALARRQEEEEALETALAMSAKASRKPGVIS